MNPAAAFERHARQVLADLEGDWAMAEDRPIRRRAFSQAAVARLVGVPQSQWHGWVSGAKSPSYRTVVGWLAAWESAGYPAVEFRISSDGGAIMNTIQKK